VSGSNNSYVTAGVDLRGYPGERIRMRFAFRADDRTTRSGGTIDDINMFESP
jgi:hypothetical protein